MCGIVGIASNSNSINALIEGLKKLAYRGYDSAGLATLVNNQIVKIPGDFVVNQEMLKSLKAMNGVIDISFNEEIHWWIYIFRVFNSQLITQR